MEKKKAIIVDLDGTLANVEHRRHFLKETPPDWRSFNESMVTDTVNEWCHTLMKRMQGGTYGGRSILLVSGRGEEYRPHTEDWLEELIIDYDKLLMRPAGDFRADEIIKREIYEEKIKDFYDVLFVIDDRSKVVKMWRSLGLVCLQCCEGDY